MNIRFHKRTFIKGITWEGSGAITLFLVAYFILPNVWTASVFSIGYTALRVCMYYIHERLWKRFSWFKSPLINEEKDK